MKPQPPPGPIRNFAAGAVGVLARISIILKWGGLGIFMIAPLVLFLHSDAWREALQDLAFVVLAWLSLYVALNLVLAFLRWWVGPRNRG